MFSKNWMDLKKRKNPNRAAPNNKSVNIVDDLYTVGKAGAQKIFENSSALKPLLLLSFRRKFNFRDRLAATKNPTKMEGFFQNGVGIACIINRADILRFFGTG